MLSNYTIKRMIPRLIIAVILVNLSYYICLIAVDISNIIGYNSYSALTSVSGDIQANTGSDGKWEDIMASLLVGGLAAGAAGIALALTLSMPVVIMSLLALLMIAFILIARQALIILLIVLAPLAFVAYLLPNTENLYKKWQGMFIALLMVFPVVGLIFGASTLASTILVGSNSGGDPGVMDVMALAVLAIPLFAVPIVLKGAMAATGSIGAKLANAQDRASSAAKSAGKQRSKERWGNTALARGYQNRKALKQKYRDRKYNEAVSGTDGSILGRARLRASKGVIGVPILNSSKFAAERAETAAGAAFDKDFQEDVSFATAAHKGLSFSEREHMAKTGRHAIVDKDGKITDGEKLTDAEHAASVNYMMENGNFGERQKIIESVGSMQGDSAGKRKVREALASGYYSSGMNKIYGSALGDQLAQGEVTGSEEEMQETLKLKAVQNIESGKMNAGVFSDGLQAAYISNLAESGYIQGSNLERVHKAAQEATVSDNIHLNDVARDSIKSINKNNAAMIQNRKKNQVDAAQTYVDAGIQEAQSYVTDTENVATEPRTTTGRQSTNNTELKIEHTQSQPTQAPTVQPNPQTSRTSPPPNTSNYTRTASGLEVPRSAVEPNPPRDQS